MSDLTPQDPLARVLALARTLRKHGTADAEDALQAAITGPDGRYLMPSGKLGRSLPAALGAWLDRCARRGRPPKAPGEHARSTVPVCLRLSPEAAARLAGVPRGERGAWVSRLVEAAPST